MGEPKPSLEWIITDRCNYDCSYCFQRVYADKQHCSDATVDAVFGLLPTLAGEWLIKLIGGEPLIHPRFFEMCTKIVAAGHRLCTTTNFSPPLARLLSLTEICGAKLQFVTASLHLHELRSLERFVDKAVRFNTAKPPETDFVVTAVMVAEDFDQLRQVEQQLTAAGVTVRFQVLRIKNRYVRYEPEIEAYLSGRLLENLDKTRHRSLFGTFCHTGHLFFKIDVNGDVVRCYNIQPGYYLGNITKGTFQRFDGPQPCLATRCTCTVPANRNMIRFGSKATAPVLIRSSVRACGRNLPFALTKAYGMLTGLVTKKRAP